MDNTHQIQIIESKIVTILGQQVMLDRDLVELYQGDVSVLNQDVRRNIAKFPHDLRVQTTKDELETLRSQNVIFNEKRDQNRK